MRATLVALGEGRCVRVPSRGVFVGDLAVDFGPETVPGTVELLADLARDRSRKAMQLA